MKVVLLEKLVHLVLKESQVKLDVLENQEKRVHQDLLDLKERLEYQEPLVCLASLAKEDFLACR